MKKKTTVRCDECNEWYEYFALGSFSMGGSNINGELYFCPRCAPSVKKRLGLPT